METQGFSQGLFVDPSTLSDDQRWAIKGLFKRYGRPCPQADSFVFVGQGPRGTIKLRTMMELVKLCLVRRLGLGGPNNDIPLWGLTKTGEAIAYRIRGYHGQGA